MWNFNKICKLMLVAVCLCILQGAYNPAQAQFKLGVLEGGLFDSSKASNADKDKNSNDAAGEAQCKKTCKGTCKYSSVSDSWSCSGAVPDAIGSSDDHDDGTITGCASNQGIFSGLISTGQEVFKGLRDLIYVVAGFGIIAVAVGGFFGNLNWKWLGAIVISLVVIASTGELLSAITGCQDFSNAMITDTLRQ